MEDRRAMDHFPMTMPGIGAVPGNGVFSLPQALLSPPRVSQSANWPWLANWGNPRPDPRLTVELLVQRKEPVLRGKFLGNGFWLLEEGGCVCDWHVTHWRPATTTLQPSG